MFISGLIKDMLGDDDEKSKEETPLSNALFSSLEKVLKYCQYHYGKHIVCLKKPLNKHIEELVCEFIFWSMHFY